MSVADPAELGVPYCNLTDCRRIMSVEGINLRIDDDPSVYPWVIDEGSRWLDEYLLGRYTQATLVANKHARLYAARFSVVKFCERRGNLPPRGFQKTLERQMEWLERIMAGEVHLPGSPRRRISAPTLSLPRVHLSPFPHTLIEPARVGLDAIQPRDYRQFRDPTDDPGAYTR